MTATRRTFLKSGLMAGATVMAGGRELFAEDHIMADSVAFASSSALDLDANFTRGVGVYPGSPAEYFGPSLVPDTGGTYRNLALLRPAIGSSSYDYNLTPQLLTDGLITTDIPVWISSALNGEFMPKYQRESLVNHSPDLLVELAGSAPTAELHLGGSPDLPEVDRLVLFVVVPESVSPSRLRFTAFTTTDGHRWDEAGTATSFATVNPADYPPDMVRGAHILKPVIPLKAPVRSRGYRVQLATVTGVHGEVFEVTFRLGQIEFYRGTDRVQLGGPYSFTSAWKPAGFGEEWVYVDLGPGARFDAVKLHWIARAAEGRLQSSDDAQTWRDLQPLPAAGQGMVDEIRLATPVTARYLRLLLTRPATGMGYLLSELEVWGRGGVTARPGAAFAPAQHGRMALSGGAWRLQRGPQVKAVGEAISTPGFHDADWLPATVPGTALVSYLNLGALPDPNFGSNQLQISDSFFYADFWYRTEFTAPAASAGDLQWLHFDGVNWKAEIFLNGASLGHIDGSFLRGRFDVTGKLRPGTNALAVLIHKNHIPASCKQKTYEVASKNGGGLGADDPTFHASVGWDWIPTIRGRNTGLWNEVALVTTGPVTLEDPLVTTHLPQAGNGRAEVTLEVFAANHAARPYSGTLHLRFGELTLQQPVQLAANEKRAVRFTPQTHPQLSMTNPKLWWPVGYGEPTLHDVELRLEGKNHAPEQLAFKAGLREMTATEEGGALRLFINGRRFIAKGGNWGFAESMLRYGAREYDAAVRYHREMHFTIIRNWVGQTGDAAFYEACDRYGVVVWQDFWLANPWDGLIPDDNAMFLANARDYVARIRRHACLGIYCGRNEWYPPAPLDKGLRAILADLQPDLHYIGSSADGPVSGHGPYRALPIAQYFERADPLLHSEIGAPAIPPMESVRAMMPQSSLWPLGLDWGLHDFTLDGAQGGQAFLALIDQAYGGAQSAEEWVKLGEIISYEAYRAMFEAQSVHRMGVLLWMSHSCWPSFVWQTYDFYFAPTSSYFACKTGAEPLHIQWNSFAETIEVVNYSAGDVANLSATVEVLNLDGQAAATQTFPVAHSAEDSTTTVTAMTYPATLSRVHFLRLTLRDATGVRSSNFYLRGKEQTDYTAIRTLPRATITADTQSVQRAGVWQHATTLRNTSATPALFVRLRAVRSNSGDPLVPAIFDDGYFALMPGETKTVHTEIREADTRGEPAKLLVEGFNL